MIAAVLAAAVLQEVPPPLGAAVGAVPSRSSAGSVRAALLSSPAPELILQTGPELRISFSTVLCVELL